MLFSRTLSFTLVALLAGFIKVVHANDQINEQSLETRVMMCPLPVFDDIALNTPKIIDSSVRISSLQASIEQDQDAVFNGSVLLVDKSQKIMADQLSFNRLKMQIEAIGNIHYQGKQINIFAHTLSASKADNAILLSG